MGCKIIEPRHRVEQYEYRLIFDMNGTGGGYAFDCDKFGNVYEDMPEEAFKNYQWCLKHPEKFVREPYVQKYDYSGIVPAKAICVCGEIITLQDDYMGACECPHCHRWYNVFGQRLVDPEYWVMDEE